MVLPSYLCNASELRGSPGGFAPPQGSSNGRASRRLNGMMIHAGVSAHFFVKPQNMSRILRHRASYIVSGLYGEARPRVNQG